MHSYFLTITRSIRTNISKLFSIVVIMLLGIAFVSGLGTISPMIQTSFGNELRRENAPDLILKSSSDTGFQDEDGDGILDIVDDLLQSRIATSAEGLTMLDSSMFESMDYDMGFPEDMPLTRFYGIPDGMTIAPISIVEGRMPVKSNEVVVERARLDMVQYSVGDTIDLGDVFGTKTVVGIVANPLNFSRYEELDLINLEEIKQIIYMRSQDFVMTVEIIPGVEGLIHVSEMSWSQHLRSAQDFLKVGDEVEAVILTLDREERKMSLGIKQLTPDPWQHITEKYPVGSRHTATVRNFTNFGIFVELEEGIDGLIHISDLSWSKKIKHPAEFTKIGEKIDVVVLDIDIENRRLSLGHKQLEENPWDVYETLFSVGSLQKGTVASVNDKGAIVVLPYGVEGFCPARHLVKADGTPLKQDEQADFKVIEFNKDNKRIVVSHSRIHQEEAAEERAKAENENRKNADNTAKAVKKLNEASEKTTLGDIAALSNLKDAMEAAEKNN